MPWANMTMSAAGTANASGYTSSMSDAKRVVKSEGFELNDEKLVDPNQNITFKEGDILKIGKNKYVKVIKE